MNQPSTSSETPSPSRPQLDEKVGVVVIGRNEGERLRRCLHSLLDQGAGPMVYVDSGSTDGSVEMARDLGVWVEPLDTSVPFTMARGRNTGFNKLMSLHPDLAFVQFVDGDCEVEPTWISQGLSLLQSRPEVVAVCGFRRERFPEASLYNRLINLEWQGPTGEINACGGDAMYRTEAFSKSGGFNEGMIAGEEPELCVRLRKAGGTIWRLDEAMTLHDAALTHFSQWWKRSTRCGHAYAEGFALQGGAPYFHNKKALKSTVALGLIVPGAWATSVAIGTTQPWLGFLPIMGTAAAAATYSKAGYGAYRARRELGNSPEDARLYAAFCMLGKLAEAQGALTYLRNRVSGKRSTLIEYKAVTET